MRFSHRLKSSPSCIVADEGQMTTQMQRLLKQAGQAVSLKPILELNPEHLLVQHLKTDGDPTHFEDISQILLDQAVLAEGGQLDDPASFIRKFNDLLLRLSNPQT